MMIWTLEATPPWRITATDRDRDRDQDPDWDFNTPFLDTVAADDRGVVAAALASVTTTGAGECECRVTIGSTVGATGHLDLVCVSAQDNARHIIAIWKSHPSASIDAQCVVDDRTMRQFLGQVSHDLRIPLNGVLGMTRLLLDSGLRAEQVDYARAIDASGEHLLAVIEDLLEFATLDITTTLLPVDFSPRALIEDVVDSLTRRAAERDIEVCALVAASVPELVNADAARLRQVLSYLISDAIAWTELGDVIVRVSREDADEPDAAGSNDGRDREVMVRFEVTASDRMHAQTFDMSPRVVVCRHLVALMGGTLGSDTSAGDDRGAGLGSALGAGPESGRTWWFTARLRARPVPTTDIPGYVSLAGKRVLCVDDHPLSQRVLLERLRGWNLQAEATDEAHSALTLMKVASAAGTPFDLAILDLRLPGMDGLELARLIKADSQLSATKLVLLTGYPARGQAARAHEAGIDAYLQKPIREAPLRLSLETLLGGGATQTALPLLSERHPTYVRSRLRPRVLVAEDDAMSQKVAVQMLERLGCRVDIVSDGTEAIDAVTRTAYHLVLMDCQMAGMNGIEAARRIRSLPKHISSPPIVALITETGEQERSQCLAAGMNDCVSKPLRLGALREKLATWIESAPLSRG